jgi:hypothetical protein
MCPVRNKVRALAFFLYEKCRRRRRNEVGQPLSGLGLVLEAKSICLFKKGKSTEEGWTESPKGRGRGRAGGFSIKKS